MNQKENGRQEELPTNLQQFSAGRTNPELV